MKTNRSVSLNKIIKINQSIERKADFAKLTVTARAIIGSKGTGLICGASSPNVHM